MLLLLGSAPVLRFLRKLFGLLSSQLQRRLHLIIRALVIVIFVVGQYLLSVSKCNVVQDWNLQL